MGSVSGWCLLGYSNRAVNIYITTFYHAFQNISQTNLTYLNRSRQSSPRMTHPASLPPHRQYPSIHHLIVLIEKEKPTATLSPPPLASFSRRSSDLADISPVDKRRTGVDNADAAEGE
ncbi:hypothetical protein HO173_007606 [Letharia columbiana]|uniref:Uncharacterized protein n=1 Tax=Letharia columbiana TaxID=112416 RepID=A0A8H6FT73_9LECA|nr:uncharacterized protein HO173_007606 [Letharia columbiana]KAF6234186.1 hypothetical protein HO173_007606 [Letharia columbiana]